MSQDLKKFILTSYITLVFPLDILFGKWREGIIEPTYPCWRKCESTEKILKQTKTKEFLISYNCSVYGSYNYHEHDHNYDTNKIIVSSAKHQTI